MSTPNRAAKLVKAHKVLKKHYDPVPSLADRSLLEHLLYACCLENASFEQADEAFARLQQSYFDWNEIRVTTVAELAEILTGLAEPNVAAARLPKPSGPPSKPTRRKRRRRSRRVATACAWQWDRQWASRDRQLPKLRRRLAVRATWHGSSSSSP